MYLKKTCWAPNFNHWDLYTAQTVWGDYWQYYALVEITYGAKIIL